MSEHLDLDALADAVAGEESEQGSAHLASCADCRARLAEVRAASEQVTRDLQALPPVPLPLDVADRLARELPPAGQAAVTTLPAAEPSRWQRLLPAAAAVVLLVAGGGYALSRLSGSGGDHGNAGSSTSSAGGGAATKAEAGFPRSSTGTDYTGRDDLRRALPALLGSTDRGGPSNAAGTLASDPLARLRTPAGLAECLLALLPPDDPSVRPLALDYASFRGRPAMVVLLPAVDPAKIDVYVVGPGCSRANDSTLFYTSVPRP